MCDWRLRGFAIPDFTPHGKVREQELKNMVLPESYIQLSYLKGVAMSPTYYSFRVCHTWGALGTLKCEMELRAPLDYAVLDVILMVRTICISPHLVPEPSSDPHPSKHIACVFFPIYRQASLI